MKARAVGRLTLLLVSILVLPVRAAPPGPLLLVSLDAFRWDYLARYPEQTPHLRGLAASGASAQALIPVFPSNTFPNHYSLVTGLYPARHGLVNNQFYDAERKAHFSYRSPSAAADATWWGGEPIWITAVLQGKRSACAFWPGSEAPIKGVHATFWKRYDEALSFEARLEELKDWLALPAEERPAVITFYIEEANSRGHKFGPDSTELAETLSMVDARVGELVRAVRAAGLEPNLVVVSDHGMTRAWPERTLVLDDFVPANEVQVDFDGPVVGLRAKNGDHDALLARLRTLPPSARAFRVEELPERLHVTPTPRTPPVWILLDEGAFLVTRERLERGREHLSLGEHGYDPAYASMAGILIAHGPAFRTDGHIAPPVESVHLYNLLCAAAGLKPAPNDGDDRLLRQFLPVSK